MCVLYNNNNNNNNNKNNNNNNTYLKSNIHCITRYKFSGQYKYNPHLSSEFEIILFSRSLYATLMPAAA